MFSLFSLCIALTWTLGASECQTDETEQIDAQGNTLCMKRLSTVLRSTNPECGIGEQALWINVAAQSNEIFYLNTAHWNATVATIGGNTITGLIEGSNIADGAITSSNIADGTITTSDIADGTIVSNDIANGAITSAKITDGTIATGDVANGAITSGKIAELTITGYNIALNAITSSKITNGHVGPSKIDSSTTQNYNMKYLKVHLFLTSEQDTLIKGVLNVHGEDGGGPSNQACFWAKGYPLATDKGDYDWEWGDPGCGSWAAKVGITAESSIYSKRYLLASDSRIKENIVPVPDNLALDTIRKLDAKYYFYKAKLERGSKRTIGFIAQDVLEHIPEAVTKVTRHIPDKLQLLENVQWTKMDDQWKMVIDELEPGNYRFYMSNPGDTSEKTLDLNTEDGKTFYVPQQYTSVFLFGRQVNDFLTLSKDKIWAISYAALQQVDKNQQALQAKVSALESTIDVLSHTIADLSQRLAALEHQ